MLQWNKVIDNQFHNKHNPEVGLYRAKMPGGWLIMIRSDVPTSGPAITFYPDTKHEWDGSSLHNEGTNRS